MGCFFYARGGTMKLRFFGKTRDTPQDRALTGQHRFLFGYATSGKPVNERSAMQMTAVYACVRILSESIAGLPLHLYRYEPDGSKTKAMENPLYGLLHDEPNPEMTSFIFRETLMTHLLGDYFSGGLILNTDVFLQTNTY